MKQLMVIFVAIMVCAGSAFSADDEQWTVVASPELLGEEAIQLAIEDLRKTGKPFGLTFELAETTAAQPKNVIAVGDPTRSGVTAKLVREDAIRLRGVEKAEGYEIATASTNEGRTICVAGGSVLGDAYGLYWIWDRLRVYKSIPTINVCREPQLDIRYTRVHVTSKEDIRRALRYGLNLVYLRGVLNFVPWNTDPERSENVRSRTEAKELIRYAHSLHLKCAAFGTDFTYHPSLLKEFGASLSPADPRFWDAVQAKYRRLLQAMPELDAVATFTGPEQSYWGEYKTFDPMHDGKDCDWSLAKRYRTFVMKVQEVVSGEFGKFLMHRTWVTNSHEQQAHAETYRKIFTDEVPVENLYLIPSFTQNDRWWHQRYNPTVNQTPHEMMVVIEQMDYHAGGGVFPAFPGQYYQAGLQTMLDVDESNLKGCSLDMPGGEGWRTRNVTAYTVFRLAWDHHEDMRQIAEDFASIHFGRAAARGMAEIYLQSPVAYKYGLYIEPVAYGEFNSLPHIRVGMFVADGYPSIDDGKVHLEFLRKIYLRCKPWMAETLQDLDHGLDTIESMERAFPAVKPTFDNPAVATGVENALRMTRHMIQTNNLYVRTCFAFFGYREEPTDENRAQLQRVCDELETTCEAFARVPGFKYQLFGVTQLIKNSRQVLDDLQKAEERFAKAPDMETIERGIRSEQEKYAKILSEYSNEAVQLAQIYCKVDGRDLIRIRGGQVETEHLRWDGMTLREKTIVNPLPSKRVSVVPRAVESRPMHPFILEQPSEENDYTVTIYLNDVPGGGDWWRFELLYIDKPPEELGLNTAW